MAVFYEILFVECFEDKVKATDHLGGKVDELIVELSIVLLQMSALYLEYVPLHHL